MRVLLLFVLLAALLPEALASASPVPSLDVSKSCRAARDFGVNDAQQTFDNCMSDENQAKRQIERRWAQFTANARASCVPAPPAPSYVEMLTCLEMNQQGPAPYSQGGGAAPASETRHDSPSPRPAPSPQPRAMRGL